MAEPKTTFEVFTLFPEAVRSFASAGLLGRAVQRGLVAVETTDFREFTSDRHRTVDDTPFGGGPGMVIKPEPVVAALEHVIAQRGPMHRVLLTPSAPRFDQRVAERLATLPRIALLCGRYEGIDDRVREHFVDECLSLGDFVLGGGELAALAIIEAVSRLLEGVVGNRDSVEGDSFAASDAGSLLEFPQYTRPADFRGHRVPEVLQGGDHAAIATWRRRASLARTWSLRPDLRPPQRWPAVAIYAVVTGEPDEAWTESLARLQLTGLVVLGEDPDHVIAWTRAAGGRTAIATFSGLSSLRRRFRSRGVPPWVVGIAAEGSSGAAQGPSALLDMLGGCADEQPKSSDERPRTLVLWGGGTTADGVDAVFAPAALDASVLASSPAIVDISRPSHPAHLVERAIAAITTG